MSVPLELKPASIRPNKSFILFNFNSLLILFPRLESSTFATDLITYMMLTTFWRPAITKLTVFALLSDGMLKKSSNRRWSPPSSTYLLFMCSWGMKWYVSSGSDSFQSIAGKQTKRVISTDFSSLLDLHFDILRSLIKDCLMFQMSKTIRAKSGS